MKIKISLLALLVNSIIYSQEIITQTRNDASAFKNGNDTPFLSGFFQANTPQNFPNTGTETGQWRHLIDVRHTGDPKFAMQLSGYFWDQNLWFRKIGEGFLNQGWSRILMEEPSGNINLKNRANVSNAGNRIQFGSLGEDTFGPYIRSSLTNANGVNSKMALVLGSYWQVEKNELTLMNGNVGINTLNPTSPLTVNGNIYAVGASVISFQDDSKFDVLKADVPALNVPLVSMPQYGIAAPSASDGAELWISGYSGIRMFTGGTSATKFYLSKNGNALLQGKLEAKEIKITLTPTADFVFEENYNLPKLQDVEKFIKENKHLPEVASAKTMEKEGVNVGEFQIKLLQKIEELTLYVIEQNNKIKSLETKIENYESKK